MLEIDRVDFGRDGCREQDCEKTPAVKVPHATPRLRLFFAGEYMRTSKRAYSHV
jgi:hypothetical protein